MTAYLEATEQRMRALGARTRDELVLRARGKGALAGGDVARAGTLNLSEYAREVRADPRYRKAQNAKPPRKIGSRLWLFDCVSCDKCIQVCPNDANFFVSVSPLARESTEAVVVVAPGKTETRPGVPYRFHRAHHLAN